MRSLSLLSVVLPSLAVACLLSACSSHQKRKTDPVKPVVKAPAVEGEKINAIYLVVGSKAITMMDYEEGADLARLFRRKKVTPKDVEEFLVEKTIVEQVADEESVVVGKERIEHEIARRMELVQDTNEDRFRERIEREAGVPFRVWKESLRYQMIRQQIVQIKVTIPQPTEAEIKEFYKKNGAKVGVELLFREIVFPPATNIAAEREIESRARQVYNQVLSNPASFGDVARSIPENVSPYKAGGGIRLWTPIDEIAREDRVLAGVLFGLPQGAVSQVFRDGSNRYRIVRIEGKRPVSLEKMREMIHMQLFYDRADEAFAKWIEEKKRTLVIRRLAQT